MQLVFLFWYGRVRMLCFSHALQNLLYIQHPRLGPYGQCCNEDLVWIENGYKDKSGVIKEGYASTEYLFLTQSILIRLLFVCLFVA